MWSLDVIRFEVLKKEGNYGQYRFIPLESGFGLTLGTALRRVLLSSIEGVAPVGIYIDGVAHEFSTINGVVEDVEQIILNIKKLVLSMEAIDRTILKFNLKGVGELKAGDLEHTSEVKIYNPALHIATVSSSRGSLSGEIYIKRGKGYKLEEEVEKEEDFPQTVIPIDAYFVPVEKVSFHVEQVRFEEAVDYDSLILEVLTKGNKSPEECLLEAVNVLIDYNTVFRDLLRGKKGETVYEEKERMSISQLNIPERTLNILKKNGINKVGDLLSLSEKDLLSLSKLGNASLRSIVEALAKLGLKLKES